MTKARILLLLLCGSALGFPACSPASKAGATTNPEKNQMPEIQYSVDTNQDGVFEPIQLDEAPIPSQGREQWPRDFYGQIRYPASARENGISGIVLLDILVNEIGQVQEVAIKKSLSKDCDAAARNAFLQATKQGYLPFKVNSIPVKFKMEFPVRFGLN